MSALSIVRFTRPALIVPLLLATLATPILSRTSHAAQARATMRPITILASHPAFPKSIPAGLLAVRVVADTHEPLDAGVARINPGSSMAEIESAGASGDMMRLSHLVTFVGGVGVPPRSTGAVVLDLRTPGQYGLHVTRGDQDPGQDFLFTVTPAGARKAALPKANVRVTLRGTHIVGLPRTLPAGTTTFKITDGGPWVRDMILFRLDPGKTVRDMIAAARVDEQTHKDPSWAQDAGSADVLSPQQTDWVTLDLTPGAYVALCPLPDPQKGGEALIFEGMIVSFTVR